MAIRLTDTPFLDSPDVGEPECVCSRCGGVIQDMAIRAWSAHGDGEMEYRYHPACLGVSVAMVEAEGDDGPVEEL